MDLAPLLQTNAPPSEHEESYLLQRISSLDDSLGELDVELALAEQTLEELSTRHSKLKDRRKGYASIMSPFRRLPVDVWIEIMKFAVWSTPDIPAEAAPSANILVRQGIIGLAAAPTLTAGKAPEAEEGSASHWPEARQLSTLTRVSKDWQHLLHDVAILWSSLELHIYCNDFGLDTFAPHLETWFCRSGQLPWSLKLLVSKRHIIAPVFASFLLRNCHRWKALKIYMQDLDILAPLFYLEPSPETKPPVWLMDAGEAPASPKEEHIWTNLEQLSLDGWFTDSAQIKPFSLVDNDSNDSVDPDSDSEGPGTLHSPHSIRLRGSMPALISLVLDLPCQKIHSWDWIPWAQLVDLDLKTGDSYEDNVSFLAKCSNALQRCSLVFTPSLRLPLAITLGPLHDVTHGVANLHIGQALDDEEQNEGGAGSEDDNSDSTNSLDPAHDSAVRLGGLKELTLKKIGYIAPILSRLTLPSLQKLHITMSSLNEPEPYLGAALIDMLDRSGCAAVEDACASPKSNSLQTSTGPPLTYLMLALENTMHRRVVAPVITNGEYLRIFERTEKLKTLHIKDFSTDARFLEKIDHRGLLPRLKRISFVVDASEDVPERFDAFVKARMNRRAGVS
ncbi:hypothetical protein D9611_001190 [Ephemerocybe angulata]|uniref:F-box domain-containing protein n=1 Tax=Ephemerocybe angulata TaxID=980116 RepID=A0A8H5FM00_9AGAR|nr:hypothetical protein D9611_001190 [Tulosesus angulatus]